MGGEGGGVGLCRIPCSDGLESGFEWELPPVDCVWKLGLQLGAALGVGPTQLKEVGPWGWTLKFVALPLCSLLPNVTSAASYCHYVFPSTMDCVPSNCVQGPLP